MRLFVPCILLVAALALATRVDLLFTVLWFLAGVYALSVLWFRQAVGRLRVSRQYIDHAFWGDEIRVTLTVTNGGRFPLPWLEISESVPLEVRGEELPDQVLSLRSREERRFTYSLSCRRRGFYQLGPLRVATGDLLGLADRVLLWEETRPVVVYPRVVPIHDLGLPTRSVLAVVPARTPFLEDTSRTVGVRDYAPGDSPRRIHWTATARTGQLLVKQFQPAIARDTMICLDLHPDYYEVQRQDAVELAIAVAASLAHHVIVEEQLPGGLAMEGRDRILAEWRRFSAPPRPGRAQLMGLLEMLARVDSGREGSFTGLLRDQQAQLPWGSTLLVVTGRIDAELGGTLLGLKRSGHAVALILVQPTHRGTVAPQLGGVPVYRVWTDLDVAVAS